MLKFSILRLHYHSQTSYFSRYIPRDDSLTNVDFPCGCWLRLFWGLWKYTTRVDIIQFHPENVTERGGDRYQCPIPF